MDEARMIAISFLLSFCVVFLVSFWIVYRDNKYEMDVKAKMTNERLVREAVNQLGERSFYCTRHNCKMPQGALPYCPECTAENFKDPLFNQFSMICMCPQCGEVDNHAWVNSTIYDEEIEAESMTRAELIAELSALGFGFTSLTNKDHLVTVWNNLHRPIASVTEGTHASIVVRECKKCSFSWQQS
jgi:hypothetical protein